MSHTQRIFIMVIRWCVFICLLPSDQRSEKTCPQHIVNQLGKLIMFKHIYFVLYNNLIAQFNKEHNMKLVCTWNPFASTSLDHLVCLLSPTEMLRGLSSMQVPCFLLNTFNILQGYIFKFLSGSEPSRAKGLKQPCGGSGTISGGFDVPPGTHNSNQLWSAIPEDWPNHPSGYLSISLSALESPGQMSWIFSSFTGCQGMSVLWICLSSLHWLWSTSSFFTLNTIIRAMKLRRWFSPQHLGWSVSSLLAVEWNDIRASHLSSVA